MTTKPEKKPTKQSRWLITILALTAIPAAVIYTDFAISNQPQPVTEKTEVNLPKVTVVPVTTGSYQATINSYGEVRSSDQLELNNEVAGTVIWRNPKLRTGDTVSAGETLLKLDSTDYQAALSEARHAAAEAKLALAMEQRQQQQAREDWKRSGLTQKPSPITLREPQLKAAKARYIATRDAVRQAERRLALTEIKAPFSAVVYSRTVTVGSYLEVGTTVSSLRSSQEAEIDISLTQSQWKQLPADIIGHQVLLRSRDRAQDGWQGEISNISTSIDQQTRLRSLTIVIEQPLAQQPALLFGSFVDVEIAGVTVDHLLPVPASALTTDGYIWTVDNQRLERYPVRPAFSRGDTLFIPFDRPDSEVHVVRYPMASYTPGIRVQAQHQEMTSEGI